MSNVVSKLENMINPQVMGDMVTKGIPGKMKFSGLCKVDDTLVGAPGSTVTLPKFAYIGDATQVAEGGEIPVVALTASSEDVEIKKAGRGVELTDEAVLGGYGDPVGNVAMQLSLAIANKVDSDVLEALQAIDDESRTFEAQEALSADVIADALVKFGDDISGKKAIIIAPEQLASLRKSESFIKVTDIGAQMLIKGTVGMIHGCQIIVSSKIAGDDNGYTNFIVKPEAIAMYLKRDTMIEADRDIVSKTTIITADKHYAVHVADDSKIIKIVTAA